MNSIIFLSFDEPNADQNWDLLRNRFPRAVRIDGVAGILEAHRACALASETEHFFLVDGDNQVLDSFGFNFQITSGNEDAIHVWRCKNPVNDLVYGYGAIKLYSKSLLLAAKSGVDLATSVSKKYVIVNELASITHFNCSPLSAWRSAFRECVKLSSQVIPGQITKETRERLDSWCTLGEDRENGMWCVAGANAGRQFGELNKNDPMALAKINDFRWLNEEFEKLKVGNKRI